jgi:hypothetical protein
MQLSLARGIDTDIFRSSELASISALLVSPLGGYILSSAHTMNGPTALFLYFSNLSLIVYLLALQPSPLWRLLGFSVVTFILGWLLITVSTWHSVHDYLIGCSIAVDFFTALYLLFLTNALDDFRHEKDVGHPRQWSLPRRMIWTSRLLFNYRGVGWNYQVSLFCSRQLRSIDLFCRPRSRFAIYPRVLSRSVGLSFAAASGGWSSMASYSMWPIHIKF